MDEFEFSGLPQEAAWAMTDESHCVDCITSRQPVAMKKDKRFERKKFSVEKQIVFLAILIFFRFVQIIDKTSESSLHMQKSNRFPVKIVTKSYKIYVVSYLINLFEIVRIIDKIADKNRKSKEK